MTPRQMPSILTQHGDHADLDTNIRVCMSRQWDTGGSGPGFVKKGGACQRGWLKIFNTNIPGIPAVELDYVTAAGTEMSQQAGDLPGLFNVVAGVAHNSIG